MTPEELREQIPGAQEEIMAARAFAVEVDELRQGSYREVQQQHQALVTAIWAITKDLPYPEQPIVLERSEETVDATTQKVRPAGRTVVQITPLSTKNEPASGQGLAVAYSLRYTFVATAGDMQVGLGQETTFDTTGVDRDGSHRVVYRVPSSVFNPENVEEFEDYRDLYLPMRAAEISTLQTSVQMIKAAMENPELNPWVEELRKRRQEERERQQEEEAREADNLAQEEAARIALQGLRDFERTAEAELAAQAPEPSRGLFGRLKNN